MNLTRHLEAEVELRVAAFNRVKTIPLLTPFFAPRS